MKKYLSFNLFVLTFLNISLFFSSCNKVNLEQEFVKDNFLKIVDTLVYSKGAFVTPGLDSCRYNDFSVHLTRKINYNQKTDEMIFNYFEKNKSLKNIFKELLKEGKYSNFSLNSKFPKEVGKYHIFLDGNNLNKNIKYAGRIDIQNLKIFKNQAILILAESVEKFGKVYIILFQKKADEWKVIKKEILYVS